MVDQVGQYNIKLPNNYYQQQSYQGGLGDKLPDNEHVQVAKEQVSDSTAGRMMMGIPSTPEEWRQFLPYLGTGLGASWGITKLANLGAKGNFEDSFLYKAGKAIDNSFLVKNPATSGISSWFKQTKQSIKNFLLKSDSVKKIADTVKIGAEPKIEMAKSFLRGFLGQSIDEVMDGVKHLPESITSKHGLKSVVDQLKAGTIDNAKAYEQIAKELKNLPINEIQKITVAKTSSFQNLWNLFGLSKTKNINLNRSINKLKFLEGKGAQSGLGKTIQSLFLKVSDAMGGGVVGGSFGIVMNAVFLGVALKQASEAPKGEKVSTFMEEMSGNMIGGYLMMAPIGNFFYKKLVGLKYLGINKEVYQNAIKNLAERMNTCKMSKEVYKEAAKGIKAMAKTDIQWYLKPLRFIGKALGTGIDKIPALTGGGKFWNRIKGIGGGTMRFALIMFVLMPPVTKAFMKLSHMIFGKPTVSQTDKDYEEKMEERRKQREGIKTPEKELSSNPKVKEMFDKLKEKNNVNNNTVKTPSTQNTKAPSSFVNNFVNKNKEQAPAAWSLNNDSKSKKEQRSYIPNPYPVQQQDENQQGFAKILENTDKYTNYAEKVLKES
jgi:hypothetical protein